MTSFFSSLITAVLVFLGFASSSQPSIVVVNTATTTPQVSTTTSISVPFVARISADELLSVPVQQESTDTMATTSEGQASTSPAALVSPQVITGSVQVDILPIQNQAVQVQTEAPVQQNTTVSAPEPESAPVQQSTMITYTVKKGDATISSSFSESDLRNFMASLDSHINWKKSAQNNPIADVISSLASNGYVVTENQ